MAARGQGLPACSLWGGGTQQLPNERSCWGAARTLFTRKRLVVVLCPDGYRLKMTQEQRTETPALRKLPHRDYQFKACLGYKIRFCLNEQNKQTPRPAKDVLLRLPGCTGGHHSSLSGPFPSQSPALLTVPRSSTALRSVGHVRTGRMCNLRAARGTCVAGDTQLVNSPVCTDTREDPARRPSV